MRMHLSYSGALGRHGRPLRDLLKRVSAVRICPGAPARTPRADRGSGRSACVGRRRQEQSAACTNVPSANALPSRVPVCFFRAGCAPSTVAPPQARLGVRQRRAAQPAKGTPWHSRSVGGGPSRGRSARSPPCSTSRDANSISLTRSASAGSRASGGRASDRWAAECPSRPMASGARCPPRDKATGGRPAGPWEGEGSPVRWPA
jgi:hypothetical protein